MSDSDATRAQALAAQSALDLRRGRFEDALAAGLHALRLQPTLPDASFCAAMACLKLGRVAEAEQRTRQALRDRPDHLAMQYVLGMAAMKQNRLADALASFDALLSVVPTDAQAHLNRALVLLLQGDFAAGWPEYEWRWRGHGFVTRPMWDGGPLAAKSIMLHAEQGLGDALQFIRFVPLVKERGGSVIVACRESLHPLLGRCAGIDRLVPPVTFAYPADEHALLMSLPAILKTTLAAVPAPVPYVFADPALVEYWRAELAAYSGFKIGIAWQGSPNHPDDRCRSMPLGAFAPLAGAAGIHWLSLQKKDGLDQLADAPFRLLNLGPRLDEAAGAFMDTAAVMMCLDLVITSDSALAHLAGALGVPAWIALPFAPDFRWLLDRHDSPWYPTARLFRQERAGAWPEVFERMAEELQRLRGE